MRYKLQLDKSFDRLWTALFGNAVHNDVYIAGGAARRLWHGQQWQHHDVDLFFANKDAYDRINARLQNFCQSSIMPTLEIFKPLTRAVELFETNNAATYDIRDPKFCPTIDGQVTGHKIQLIKKQWYNTLEDVWQDFDFTVCQYAANKQYVMASDDALKDTAAARISMVKNTIKPLKVARVIKYGIYGFSADKAIMQELVNKHLEGKLVENEGSDADEY